MQGMLDDFWKVLAVLAVLIAAVALGIGFLVGRI
jgi:hypothetical protein